MMKCGFIKKENVSMALGNVQHSHKQTSCYFLGSFLMHARQAEIQITVQSFSNISARNLVYTSSLLHFKAE